MSIEMNESRKMMETIVKALEDKKAVDIKVIDISEISSIADYFVIAGGSNVNQLQTMSDNIDNELARIGYTERQVEGYETANWILLDYKDVIVHLFDQENRLFYDIERIWRDGKVVDLK